MAWTDWIDDILMGIGAYQDRKSAKAPDVPEPIDPELLKALMFQNSQSPWGNLSWSEGDDGSMTSTYEFTPAQQALYDRGVDRAANPDQAYQMGGDLRSLKDALTARRLQSLGITPQGGGGSAAPFDRIEVQKGNPGIASQSATAQQDSTQSSVRDQGSRGGFLVDAMAGSPAGRIDSGNNYRGGNQPYDPTQPYSGEGNGWAGQLSDATLARIASGADIGEMYPGLTGLALTGIKSWAQNAINERAQGRMNPDMNPEWFRNTGNGDIDWMAYHQAQGAIGNPGGMLGLGGDQWDNRDETMIDYGFMGGDGSGAAMTGGGSPEQFSRVGSSPFFYGNRGSGFYDRWGNRNPYDPYVPPKPASKDK